MSDVNETLQDLMERRLREMGHRRGRGESISLREAYQRLADQVEEHNTEQRERMSSGKPGGGKMWRIPTYEVFRRIRNGHTSITDPTASALATMLDVPVEDVFRAAGIRPRLGRFELPTRADRLDQQQRAVILSVVDAILEAGEAQPAEATPPLRVAARRTDQVQSGRRAGRRQDDDAHAGDPDGPEYGA